jgi:transcriptional regulator with XRE-family HTH domain
MMNTARFIRKRVFKLTQIEFAAECGVVQSSVARWEKAGFVPQRFHDLVRGLAQRRGVSWQNIWFVEVPASDHFLQCECAEQAKAECAA